VTTSRTYTISCPPQDKNLEVERLETDEKELPQISFAGYSYLYGEETLYFPSINILLLERPFEL
jgi:hypothetical protein